MSFEKINEFDKYRRELLNKLNLNLKKKSELTLRQKEISEDYEHSNKNVELKRELDAIKKELKTVSLDITKLKNDVKHIDPIIKILSYIGEDEIINDVKNNI